MTQSGRSLFFFGIYIITTALLFITMPERLISLMQLPSIPVVWGRFIGLLALVIGCYDIFCGWASLKPFIKISIYIRFGFASGAILLFAFGEMPATIILLGAVDILGALWTMMALRSESSQNKLFAK